MVLLHVKLLVELRCIVAFCRATTFLHLASRTEFEQSVGYHDECGTTSYTALPQSCGLHFDQTPLEKANALEILKTKKGKIKSESETPSNAASSKRTTGH